MPRRFALVALAFVCGLVACAKDRTPAPVVYGGSRAHTSADAVPVYNVAYNQKIAEAPLGYVKVQPGDTVYKLSRIYKVSPDEIMAANNMRPPYALTVGDFVRIPSAPSHVVTPGETLYAVSRQYEVDVATLAIENDLRPPYTLSVGQTLRVPTGAMLARPEPKAKVQNRLAWKRPEPRQPVSAARPAVRVEQKPLPKVTKASYQKGGTAAPGAPFIWPVEGDIISNYGTKRSGRRNDGVNIRAEEGAAVRAAASGEVAYRGNELDGYGNLLLIKHEGGWVTAYAHNKSILVRKGQKVRQGQIVARVGKTGSVDTPQLHFEIRRELKALDPATLIASR